MPTLVSNRADEEDQRIRCRNRKRAARRKAQPKAITCYMPCSASLVDPVTTCQRCQRPREFCRRHDHFRLSWPRENDKKRAIVGKLPALGKESVRSSYVSDIQFVKTSYWDIDTLYVRHGAAASSTKGQPPPLNVPLPWKQLNLQLENQELLQYFQEVASQALASYSENTTALGEMLLRIAQSNDSKASTAILEAILAFSVLHRYGVSDRAVEMKISAIRALATTARGDECQSTAEAVQCAAACMLLYSFEIQQSSCTSSDWTGYFCTAKEILNQPLVSASSDEDVAVLLDWAYYNDVIARFSLRHWSGYSRESSTDPKIVRRLEDSYMSSPTFAMLDLLSEISDLVPRKITYIEEACDFQEYLKILSWRIRSTPVTTTIDELHQLSTLVYLDRISSSMIRPSVQTEENIDRAFQLLSKLDTCERQYPIAIIGPEAGSDEQRAIVLELIARTEKGVASRSFNFTRRIVEAIWAEQDLCGNETLAYWDRLTSTIDRARIAPIFV